MKAADSSDLPSVTPTAQAGSADDSATLSKQDVVRVFNNAFGALKILLGSLSMESADLAKFPPLSEEQRTALAALGVDDLSQIVSEFKILGLQVKGALDERAMLINQYRQQIAELQQTARGHQPIPDEEMAAEMQQTFARVERITGVEIPQKNRSTIMAEVCYDLLEKLYVRDPLTDLLSHHSLVEILERTLAERRENRTHGIENKPCTVVVCDMNRFTSYNSKFSYEKTDQILVDIAQELRHLADMSMKRYRARWKELVPNAATATEEELANAKDIIDREIPPETREKFIPLARLNTAGDEFCFILPCDRQTAERAMENMNRSLSQHIAKLPNATLEDTYSAVGNISLSYGCHELDTSITTVSDEHNNDLEFNVADTDIKRVLTKASQAMQEYKRKLSNSSFYPEIPREPHFIVNPDLPEFTDAHALEVLNEAPKPQDEVQDVNVTEVTGRSSGEFTVGDGSASPTNVMRSWTSGNRGDNRTK